MIQHLPDHALRAVGIRIAHNRDGEVFVTSSRGEGATFVPTDPIQRKATCTANPA